MCSKTFVDIKEENSEFYLMCKNGRIYRISNIIGNELSETIINGIDENMTYNMNETLTNNVILDVISQTKYNFEISAYSVCHFKTELMHLYSGNGYIYLKCDEFCSKVAIPKVCRGVRNFFDCDDFVLVLFENGALYEICPYTSLFWDCPNVDGDNIKNVIIMKNNDSNIELLMLVETASDKDKGSLFIKVIEYPSKTKISLLLFKFTLDLLTLIFVIFSSDSNEMQVYVTSAIEYMDNKSTAGIC